MNVDVKGLLKAKQWRFCVRKWTHRSTLCGVPASGMPQKPPACLGFVWFCKEGVKLAPQCWFKRHDNMTRVAPIQAYTQRDHHHAIHLWSNDTCLYKYSLLNQDTFDFFDKNTDMKLENNLKEDTSKSYGEQPVGARSGVVGELGQRNLCALSA